MLQKKSWKSVGDNIERIETQLEKSKLPNFKIPEEIKGELPIRIIGSIKNTTTMSGVRISFLERIDLGIKESFASLESLGGIETSCLEVSENQYKNFSNFLYNILGVKKESNLLPSSAQSIGNESDGLYLKIKKSAKKKFVEGPSNTFLFNTKPGTNSAIFSIQINPGAKILESFIPKILYVKIEILDMQSKVVKTEIWKIDVENQKLPYIVNLQWC